MCDRLAPGRGGEIAGRWRARQLEASWLRTVMERWVDFDVVTREALVATLDEFEVNVPDDLDATARAFEMLALAEGAAAGVRALHEAGIVTGVLTNASAATLGRSAERIDLPFDHLLSVDAARRFKPHPAVYGLAIDATGMSADEIGFVTANGWDAAGAASFGFRVAWLRAGPAATMPAVGVPEPIFATWGEVPTVFGATP